MQAPGICQHCGDEHMGVQVEGHKFCRNYGKVKSGPSTAILKDFNKYKNTHWTAPLDHELAGAGVFYGETADEVL